MSLLCLDLATRSGWALAEPGGKITSGSIHLNESTDGARFHRLSLWLNDNITVHGITTIGFFAPILMRTDTPGRIYRLFGLPCIVEMVCHRRGLPEPWSIDEAAAMVYLTGTARHGGRDKKKAATIARCRELGLAPVDNDAADATMGLLFMEAKMHAGIREITPLLAKRPA